MVGRGPEPVAVRPAEAVPPVGTAAFQEAFATVTVVPERVNAPFQVEPSVQVEGRSKRARQVVRAGPSLRT
ncbi:hypothetical protein GCM10022214_50900 [Actinomadura miaoliensis]|uniref:Uncharacterized protein n=1 Tax=Actinomadura miaoliensis TaxID=430685 RepID=A0ABP7WAH9_9ACTN